MRCAASTCRCSRANWRSCSAPRGAASRRFSTSSAASTRRRAGAVRFRGRELTRFSDRELTSLPAQLRRLHLPVLQPHPEPHGARERGAGERDRAPSDEAGGGAGAGRPGQPARPLPGAAFGRRAAARRHRPRRRQAARDHAVRRADRRARFEDRHPGAGGARPRPIANSAPPPPSSPTTSRSACIGDRVFRFIDGQIAGVETNERRLDASQITLVSPMRALDRKLIRDFRRLWAQSLADRAGHGLRCRHA